MNAGEVQESLIGLPLGQIRYFDQIDSTNIEAANWVDSGAPNLSLVAADEQMFGRGRAGRRWFTPAGASLAFSLIIKNQPPTCFPIPYPIDQLVARLTALGAIAVTQALLQDYGLRAEIKWPNDVLLGKRKVAGVLTEAHWMGGELTAVILGIGVNVTPAAVPQEGELLFPATCIETSLGRAVQRPQILRSILSQILSWFVRLDSPEFMEYWDSQLAFKGERVYLVTDTGDGKQEWRPGVVVGLDESGCLRVQDQSGALRVLRSGEVRLRPFPSPARKPDTGVVI